MFSCHWNNRYRGLKLYGYILSEDEKEWTTVSVKDSSILLTNLTPNTKYEIEIRSMNLFTESNPTEIVKYTSEPCLIACTDWLVGNVIF